MSRIAATFAALKAERRAALIPFVEAFDPDRATSLALLTGMAAHGADIIEIGVPFTDPMADGPIIQAAARRALLAGATLPGVLALVAEFRATNNHTPLVLMGYLNPILSYGVEVFCADAAAVGVDGLIVVDLPTEEADLLLPAAHQHGLDVIRLIAPTTTDERLPKVLAGSSGFVYYVSITGITGTRTATEADLARDIPRIRRATSLPIAVGFGIRTPAQAATVARHADAAIVASALIEKLTTTNITTVLADVAALSEGIRSVLNGQCIFCPNKLDDDTKPEHILQNAFGGRKTTRKVICSSCNNMFGGGIDKALTEQFASVRNLLQLPSGTGKGPPMLRNVESGHLSVAITGDGKIRTFEKPFSITTSSDGSKHLEVRGSFLEEIESHIPNIAALLKVSEDRVRALLSLKEAKVIERRPDPIKLSLVFGGHQAMRSAAKSCLILWATLVGNEEVRKHQYDEVRNFILGINPNFFSERTNLDSRTHDISDQMVHAYGPVFSLIYVRSDGGGRVVGHFTIFNIISFFIVLCESDGARNKKIGLISDPLPGGHWSDTAAEEFDLSFETLSKPTFDEKMKETSDRLDKVMKMYTEVSQKQEIRRIINDVIDSRGFGPDDLVTEENFAPIAAEISTRVTHHLFNVPYETKMTADQLREFFQREAVSEDKKS